MALVVQYASCDVLFFTNGIPVTHFAQDSMFRIEGLQEKFKLLMGVRGEYTWVKNLDNSAMIILTLDGASPSNNLFSTLIKADEFLSSGSFNVSIYAPGQNAITASDCRFARDPDMEWLPFDSGEREWKIIVPNLINVPLSPNIFIN